MATLKTGTVDLSYRREGQASNVTANLNFTVSGASPFAPGSYTVSAVVYDEGQSASRQSEGMYTTLRLVSKVISGSDETQLGDAAVVSLTTSRATVNVTTNLRYNTEIYAVIRTNDGENERYKIFDGSEYRANTPPELSLTVPTTLWAGRVNRIVCTITDPEGDAVTGLLQRYYMEAGGSAFRGANIWSLNGSGVIEDTLPESYAGGQVYYRLLGADELGAQATEVRSVAKAVQSNTAPTVPGSISIPSTIAGNSTITVTWTESTDVDGNLAGYYVDRSTDGGTSWARIYQGDALSTKNIVEYGTASVIFRVKAYDSAGEESGWRTSPQVTVSNNHPPTRPASLSVPATILAASSIVISWGASTDEDAGDTVTYVLERAADSTINFQQIYSGAGRTFTDTVGSWGMVRYRVKAMDNHGASSDYRTVTRTVTANAVPSISCAHADNTDLGVKTEPFSFTYSVNDTNADDALTVTETVDGVRRRTFAATREPQNMFQFRTGTAASTSYWQKLLNGSHTIRITVSDGKESASLTLTFVKSVTGCTITLDTPVTADTGKEFTAVGFSICGEIPEGGLTTVQVTVSASDETPVWEDILIDSGDAGYAAEGRRKSSTAVRENAALEGGNHVFLHEFAAPGSSFNFRIQADAAGGEGGYISSVQFLLREEEEV